MTNVIQRTLRKIYKIQNIAANYRPAYVSDNQLVPVYTSKNLAYASSKEQCCDTGVAVMAKEASYYAAAHNG